MAAPPLPFGERCKVKPPQGRLDPQSYRPGGGVTHLWFPCPWGGTVHMHAPSRSPVVQGVHLLGVTPLNGFLPLSVTASLPYTCVTSQINCTRPHDSG